MDKHKNKNGNLKKRIIEEMTVSHSSALERYFDVAKRFIRLTRDGKVNVTIKDRLTGEEQILLYLIGKLYAKEAGLAVSEEVSNRELMQQLDMPRGSLLPFLKRLRDKNKMEELKRGKYTYHRISINLVGPILDNVQEKIKI